MALPDPALADRAPSHDARVWVPAGPFSTPYRHVNAPPPEEQGTILAAPLVPVRSFARIFRATAKPRSVEAAAEAARRIERERALPPLHFSEREVPMLQRHRASGALAYWAFVADPLEPSNCELGRAVAAQMPAVLAVLEARLARELGQRTPEEIRIDGTWVERLRQFVEGYIGERAVAASPRNARTLAMRFADEQWHEVILVDLLQRRRYQHFVLEAGERQRYADRPVDDRDEQRDETAFSKHLFQQLGPARANRDEWLRQIGVVGRRYPTAASTIGLG